MTTDETKETKTEPEVAPKEMDSLVESLKKVEVSEANLEQKTEQKNDERPKKFARPKKNVENKYLSQKADLIKKELNVQLPDINGLNSWQVEKNNENATASTDNAKKLYFLMTNKNDNKQPQNQNENEKKKEFDSQNKTAQMVFADFAEIIKGDQSEDKNQLLFVNNEIQVANLKDTVYEDLKSFRDLSISSELVAVLNEKGFVKPSSIQATTLPLSTGEARRNLIAQSQNGTGKTLAFVISVLMNVDEKLTQPQALVLAPTMELAVQIASVFENLMSALPDVKLRLAVRDEVVSKEGGMLTEQIIVGTAGTVLKWATNNRTKVIDLRTIQMLVLDEADVFINLHGQIESTVNIKKNLNESAQVLFFSATFPEDVVDFAKKLLYDPVLIRLNPEQLTLKNVLQFYVRCPTDDMKLEFLINMHKYMLAIKTVIFSGSRINTTALTAALKSANFDVSFITGQLSTEERNNVIKKFRADNRGVLLATDLIARGIDIPATTLVVNYELPHLQNEKGDVDFETYLHRIGRTGRFGRKGLAVNVVCTEEDLGEIRKIEKHFGVEIRELNPFDKEKLTEFGYKLINDKL